jgi:hypothetical protein
VEPFPQTFQEEQQTVHLIAADTAFQLAREHRERLQLDFPRQTRRTRRRLRGNPALTHLPGSPPDAA